MYTYVKYNFLFIKSMYFYFRLIMDGRAFKKIKANFYSKSAKKNIKYFKNESQCTCIERCGKVS